MNFERLREIVAGRRRAVLSDVRRADAIVAFRRLYGIPETNVLDHMAVHGCFLMRADAAVCAVRDTAGLHWHGAAHAELPAAPMRAEDCMVDWVVAAGTPLLFDDETGFPHEFSDVAAMGWRAVAGLPLLLKGVVVGAILIGRNGGVPWGTREHEAIRHWMAMHAILNERRLATPVLAPERAKELERLGAVFERAAIAMALVDPTGRFEKVNFALSELMARPFAEITGGHVRDFFRPVEGDPTGTFLEEMLAGKRRGYAAERLLSLPDGSIRRVRVTTVQLRYEHSGQHSHLAIVEDLTDLPDVERLLHAREEALRQSQRRDALSQLAGGVVHEFSNSLAAITGFASLLRDDIAPEDPRRDDVEEILRITERSSGLASRLMAMSQQQQLDERATFDLREVLRAFASVARRVLPTTIEWRLDVPREEVLATIERTQFEQVLLSLVVNARDAMPGGGELRVSLSTVTQAAADGSPRRLARIAVRDTGPGIPEEHVSRLWDPFFTTKEGGSGLGLPVSRAILREHDGDLQLESRPGEGATFAMYVAAEELAAPAAADAGDPGAPLRAPATGHTILFVEDEHTVRVTSVRLLERAGYVVISAADGEEAWSLFLEHEAAVDLVVTDLQMPKLAGSELINRIRVRLPNLDILVTSAHPEPGTDVRRLRGQVTTTLRKPFPATVLIESVRTLLSGKPPRRP